MSSSNTCHCFLEIRPLRHDLPPFSIYTPEPPLSLSHTHTHTHTHTHRHTHTLELQDSFIWSVGLPLNSLYPLWLHVSFSCSSFVSDCICKKDCCVHACLTWGVNNLWCQWSWLVIHNMFLFQRSGRGTLCFYVNGWFWAIVNTAMCGMIMWGHYKNYVNCISTPRTFQHNEEPLQELLGESFYPPKS